MRVAPHLLTHFFVEVVVNPQPRPVPLPEPEVMVDTLLTWQSVRQRAPRATAADEVLERIDDLTQRVAAMSPARLLRWQ